MGKAIGTPPSLWSPGREDRINLGYLFDRTARGKFFEDITLITGKPGDREVKIRMERDAECIDQYTVHYDDHQALIQGTVCKRKINFSVKPGKSDDVRWKNFVTTLRKYDNPPNIEDFSPQQQTLTFALDVKQSHTFRVLMDPLYELLRNYMRILAIMTPVQRTKANEWLGEVNSALGIPSLEALTFDAFFKQHGELQLGQAELVQWGEFFALIHPAESLLEKAGHAFLSTVGSVQPAVDRYKAVQRSKSTSWSSSADQFELSLDQIFAGLETAANPLKRIPDILAEQFPHLPKHVADQMKTAYQTWVKRRLPYMEPDKTVKPSVNPKEQALALGFNIDLPEKGKTALQKRLHALLQDKEAIPTDLSLVESVYVTHQFHHAAKIESALNQPLSSAEKDAWIQFWKKEYLAEILKPVLEEAKQDPKTLWPVQTRVTNLLTAIAANKPDYEETLNAGVDFDTPSPEPIPAGLPPETLVTATPPVLEKTEPPHGQQPSLPWIFSGLGVAIVAGTAGYFVSQKRDTDNEPREVGRNSLFALTGAGLCISLGEIGDYSLSNNAAKRNFWRRLTSGLACGAGGYFTGSALSFPPLAPVPQTVPPDNNGNGNHNGNGNNNGNPPDPDAKHPTGGFEE